MSGVMKEAEELMPTGGTEITLRPAWKKTTNIKSMLLVLH